MTDARLKSQWFYILLALAAEDLHGSGIVRNVLEHTDGTLRLWPATLYGALEAMVDDGLIQELASDQRPEGQSERRRYYRITDKGRGALSVEAERMARLASTARQTLGGRVETA
jgi:DNA-binding PadR family transcriptional regulator